MVILQITRNDYANAKMSPANTVASAGYLADAIHEANPSVRVRIMTYTREVTENAVAGVAWDAQRDALAALAATRSPWCDVIWGGDFWTLEDAALHNTTDPVHPNDWGQEKMTAGSVGDDFPFRPEDLGTVFAHYKAGADLLGGPVAGTPTAFNSAPALAISGTSTVPGHLRVEMTRGGTRGGTPAPRFAWSFLRGGIWGENDVAMPANGVYTLGTTGVVLTFPAGSYNNLMYWEHKLGVGQLVDMSGNLRHVSAFSSANLATYEADSLGHKPALSFGSVMQQYRLAGVTLNPPYAIFAVAKKNGTAAAGTLVGRNGSLTTGALMYVNTATSFAFNDGQVQRNMSGIDPLIPHLYGVIVDGANSALIVDGTSAVVSLNNVPLTAYTIGGDSQNSFRWDGVISDVLFLGGRPSETAIRAILRRARHEYGTP
ncbi:SGNH/GDSL hydrolase family protein [Sorangium sp. So ce119]|uniref:hypothetical protein n=1 Tax=Sorangium sp. So ce119 TaxID=3133279 RepID=UPI003F6371A2